MNGNDVNSDRKKTDLRNRFDAAVRKTIDREINRQIRRQIDERLHYIRTKNPYDYMPLEDLLEESCEARLCPAAEYCLYGYYVPVYNEAFARAIDRLTNRRREIILLDLRGLSNKETSVTLKIQDATIRTEKSLAKNKIRKSYDGYL